jgi:hypothetical protein
MAQETGAAGQERRLRLQAGLQADVSLVERSARSAGLTESLEFQNMGNHILDFAEEESQVTPRAGLVSMAQTPSAGGLEKDYEQRQALKRRQHSMSVSAACH